MIPKIKKYLIECIQSSQNAKQSLLEDEMLDKLFQCASLVESAYRNGNKVIIAGNGGSAADAQHMAAEFVGRFYFDRPALPAIALTTDSSILTAIGNDYGYDKIFRRQLEAHGKMGDVYIAISTSGNSNNIVESLKVCKEMQLITIGLTGNKKCQMDNMCDIVIKVNSNDTPRIQETHLLIEHIICDLVENALFAEVKDIIS